MNCLECQELLQRRLDGELPADSAALEQHLRVCPTCREQHQSAQVLLDGLRAAVPPMPPEYLAPRIVAAVVQDQKRQLHFRRCVWTATILSAPWRVSSADSPERRNCGCALSPRSGWCL